MIFSLIASLAGSLWAAPPQNPLPLAAPTGAAATAVTPAPEAIGPIDIPGDSLDQMLELLQRWTGRTLLRAQNLPHVTLTLKLDHTVGKAEAVRALETLLNLNGIAVTPLGDQFLKVTTLNAAKSEAPELIAGSMLELPPGGRIASKLFQLHFLRVKEFIPLIAKLLNPALDSPPVVFDQANATLVTDSISNLQRVETLVQRLDQPSLDGLQPKFYPLHAAKASDVVKKVQSILTDPLKAQLGPATSLSADDRTNQIVLLADPRQYPFFDQLIAKLDVRADPNTRNEVIYLKHAAAKDVASILTDLVTGQNNAAKKAGGDSASIAPRAKTEAITEQAQTVALATQLNLKPTTQFSDLLTILPEERSNSIVVSGTVDDLRLIQSLVTQIDVLLAQVRIEVVIAEVTLDDNATSGISQLGLEVSGDQLVGFSGATAGLNVTNGAITRPAGGGLDLAAIIGLGTTPRKSDTKILSVPTIVTTHNKEASIFVGETRPTINSYLADTSVAGTIGSGYRSTVGQQQIGITLKVKPLIGKDGSVQLEIHQEVSDVVGEVTLDGNQQPIIGERKMDSFVSTHSGDIIVLGGLQKTTHTRSTSRLGPIPIIGDLLGARSRDNNKTDLVFFLRPTILSNSAAANTAALQQVQSIPEPQRSQVQNILRATAGAAGHDPGK